VAIAVQTAIAYILAITSTFERLAILANLATLVLYGACCLAAYTLRRRGVAQAGQPLSLPGGLVTPWLACAVIVWLLTSIRADEWAALGVTLAIALALYGLARARRQVRGAEAGT
jgi:amino acid transporter